MKRDRKDALNVMLESDEADGANLKDAIDILSQSV